jgi:tetratricopeptide (TPR) repeat protein
MNSFWPSTRRRRWLLLVILLIGCALRLWLWLRSPPHQPANDEVEYLQVARDLLAGRGWRFYEQYHWLRAPLYPLWLAGSLWLTQSLPGAELRWAALPNIALSCATIYLYYLLGRAVGARVSSAETSDPADPARGERVGLITATSAALLLTFSTFASLWMSETLFTTLFICTLLLLLRCAAQPPGARKLWLAAAAGALLGLTTLTRSQPLTAIPLVALWLLIDNKEQTAQNSRRVTRMTLVCSLFLVLGSVLVIAPWTLSNYRAYGGFIPVETGLSFNLWAFNEPRESLDTIYRTLEEIPNPVARSDYATAKGLARLREDPTILLRKLWPNWNDLLRVKPIEDRFLQANYYEDVPFTIFTLALALDDGLYSVLAVLGLCGLLLAPLDRRKLLLGGWLLYVVAVILLTHGEPRYRHFIFPVLLPYAAWLLVALARPLWRRHHLLALTASLLLLTALLWRPLVQLYPRAWAERNLRRGWAIVRAELSADPAAAIGWRQRAVEIDPGSPDALLGLGTLYQRLGRDDEAIATFERAFALEPSYVATNIRLGDAYRRAGRAADARLAFKGHYTDALSMLDWAWSHLDTPPPAAIDVGDGLDFGFVHGVYADELQISEGVSRHVRWTQRQAELKLAGSAAPGLVRLTLAAPWPDDRSVPAAICINGACQSLLLDARWRTIVVSVAPADEYRVRISAPTFQPRQFEPQSPDARQLGVMIDQAARVAFDPR